MDKPAIIYAAHPDVTPELELNALAAVYRIILAKKEAAGPRQADSFEDEKERSEDDSLARTHCT